jgi:hypothetical protein
VTTDDFNEAGAQKQAVEDALAADREKSLRDLFAASAMGALIAKYGEEPPLGARVFLDRRQRLCEEAYDYADDMLEARKAPYLKARKK